MEEPTNPVIPPRPAPASLVGTVLAERYQVLRIIAEGGMGSVYLAEHITIGRRLAVKVLSTDLGNSPEVVQRFLQEARAASMIQHEHIVDIIDFGYTEQGQAFLAMEHLEGEDLATTLEREGRLPWARLRRMVLQICRALNAAHEKGVIHRDMKPDNCFRIKRGGNADFIKLLDFGIAKVVTESGTFRGKKPVAATEAGTLLGTPEYMAPELARDCVPDARVDIYSLGVMIYELLTGVVPFKGETFMSTVAMHLTQDVVPPRQRAPSADIPPAIEAVIMKALAKDPNERFQNIREMTEAIVAADQRLRSTGLFLPAVGDPTLTSGVEAPADPTLQSSPGPTTLDGSTPSPKITGRFNAVGPVATTGQHRVVNTGQHAVVTTGQHRAATPAPISSVQQPLSPSVLDTHDHLVETLEQVRPNPYRWLSAILALVVIGLGITVWQFTKQAPADPSTSAAGEAPTTTPVAADAGAQEPGPSTAAVDSAPVADSSAAPEPGESAGEEPITDPRFGTLAAITDEERRQVSADLQRAVKKCSKSYGIRPADQGKVSVGLRVEAATGKINADMPSEVINTLFGSCILEAVNSTQFAPGRKQMRFEQTFAP
ncbi:MAG: protein kinase [Myxococcales bacterium]|nr:protein kinase [Myxococcales bacterium]